MCPYAAIKPRGAKVLLVSRPTKLREDNSDRRDALGMFFPHSGKDIHVCTHIHAYVYVLGLTVFEKSPTKASKRVRGAGERVGGKEGQAGGREDESRVEAHGRA